MTEFFWLQLFTESLFHSYKRGFGVRNYSLLALRELRATIHLNQAIPFQNLHFAHSSTRIQTMDSRNGALQMNDVQLAEFYPDWLVDGIDPQFNLVDVADISSIFPTTFETSEGNPPTWTSFPGALEPLQTITDTGSTLEYEAQPSTEMRQPDLKQRYSHRIFLAYKRTRRTFGPVKGNNKTGRRGKLICLECRKIRSKVNSSTAMD